MPPLLNGEVKTLFEFFKHKVQSEGQISHRVMIAFSHVFQSTEILDIFFTTIPLAEHFFLITCFTKIAWIVRS